MPAPTEKEILTNVIELLDDDSKANANLKVQKWFLLITTVVFIIITIISYEFDLIPLVWLFLISGLGGMSLMGLVLIHQIQFQTSVLKPYINISAIKERIDELKI